MTQKIQTNTDPNQHVQDHEAFYITVNFVTQKFKLIAGKKDLKAKQAYIILYFMKLTRPTGLFTFCLQHAWSN